MKNKLRFIQEYFSINPEHDFGYLIIIEVLDDKPTGRSYVAKIPKSFHFYEETHFYYATSPN
jgi:hypothetical protein